MPALGGQKPKPIDAEILYWVYISVCTVEEATLRTYSRQHTYTCACCPRLQVSRFKASFRNVNLQSELQEILNYPTAGTQ
jgi:hypothetical protein